MKSNGFQPLCLCSLCWSPVSSQLDSWPRQWCYLTSRWWPVVPGGKPPATSQPPPSLPSLPQHRQPIRDNGAPIARLMTRLRRGTHKPMHLSWYGLCAVSLWCFVFLPNAFQLYIVCPVFFWYFMSSVCC